MQKWKYYECRYEWKALSDWGSCKDEYMRDPSTCDGECNKASKIGEYLDAKNCSCEKCLIGKLVLGYEDEISNATEISFDNKKVTCGKISLVIICLLLLVVASIACY